MSTEDPYTQKEHEPYKKGTDAFINSLTSLDVIST